jgi:hypothetical protein
MKGTNEMLAEFVQKILTLGTPHYKTVAEIDYTDKPLSIITPPAPSPVSCSTLQGLVDLYESELDEAKTKGVILCQIESPTEVQLISRDADKYGRRKVWAQAEYPRACQAFPFGQWLNPENFIISAQAGFQRVKVEGPDGDFAKDLDYVLRIASGISAEAIQTSDDDGISQRITAKAGVVLKDQQSVKARVTLAPYRTFAEIDQVPSLFIFRARIQGDQPHLALFEGDGGRWRLDATAAIKAWLQPKFGKKVPVIS